MKFTLLFDLDDTLLATGTDQFLHAYMKALGGHLAKVVDPDRMIPQLLSATGEMVKNQRPDRTLEQVFDDAFYAPLGLEKPVVIDIINDFYANRFPVLRNTTHPRPKAIRLINNLLAQGHRVVIATNPVFPQTAIEQRLEWAGLSSADYDFAIVPGFEHFHFAKPNPAYYTELLARLGYPTDPVIMVGNDPKNDIIPSSQVGILPFFLHKDDLPVPPEAIAHGDFDDLEDWLENLQPEQGLMRSELHHLPILRTTPAVLSHFSTEIS
ncbi:MAG: HAD family hydrolase, partial [Anaerolineaceae bacterium]